MANIQERAGSVMVRVGGNTQEQAQLVPSTPDGRILEKDQAGTFNPVSKCSLMSNYICANGVLDKHTTVDIHPRSDLHVEERFLTSQCSVVPWYTHLCSASHSLTTHTRNVGMPFFNVTPPQLAIVELGQAVLGDFLLGVQAGNEPDLYAAHNHRPAASILP